MAGPALLPPTTLLFPEVPPICYFPSQISQLNSPRRSPALVTHILHHTPLSLLGYGMLGVNCFWSTPWELLGLPHPEGEATSPQAGKCFRRLLVSSIWDEIAFIPAICIGGCSPWITAHCLGTLIPGEDTQALCKMFFLQGLFGRPRFKGPFGKILFPRPLLQGSFLENPFWKHHLPQDPPCSPKMSGIAVT